MINHGNHWAYKTYWIYNTFFICFSLTVLTYFFLYNVSLKKTISYYFVYYNLPTPKPHAFVNSSLHCGLDLAESIAEVSRLLPQLSDFISQFNTTVVESNVNVITDSAGSMSIDVPKDMSDAVADKIITRVGLLDRLITSHGQSINEVFKNGLAIEDKLKANNPNYVSQLSDQIAQFNKLNASYKH